ncbi:hypothetical protein, partial [Sansalvadorimonas verongulae]|uniref:hypothetical protein n=1 Tax=Sansalvadorimonas verongulae TaxID=2172824 RepID=UPI001E62E6E7
NPAPVIGRGIFAFISAQNPLLSRTVPVFKRIPRCSLYFLCFTPVLPFFRPVLCFSGFRGHFEAPEFSY